MATFNFQVITTQGKTERGTIQAESPRLARQQLRERGLTVIQLTPVSQTLRWGTHKGRSIKSSDLALITRQLATLVTAAIPIDEALQAVAQQCEKPELTRLLTQVRNKVLEGHSLAESLREYPRTFDKLFCSMIAAGEASGHLGVVLLRLAEHTEQSQQMKSKLMQAMIYPLVLTLVAIGVIALLLAAVVPKVVEQFIHMKQALPITTQLLMATSDFIVNYGLLILLCLSLLLFISRYLLKKPQLRLRWHQQLLKLPVIGKLSRELNTARYAQTLSILHSSAVPLLDAMRISASVLSNDYIKERLLTATDKVREGSSLSQALTESQIFPPMMLHLVTSGENSGELGTMLRHSATMQEQSFTGQITIALSLFEPLLVLTMASVVLFIILAILQPILQLNNMMG